MEKPEPHRVVESARTLLIRCARAIEKLDKIAGLIPPGDAVELVVFTMALRTTAGRLKQVVADLTPKSNPANVEAMKNWHPYPYDWKSGNLGRALDPTPKGDNDATGKTIP